MVSSVWILGIWFCGSSGHLLILWFICLHNQFSKYFIWLHNCWKIQNSGGIHLFIFGLMQLCLLEVCCYLLLNPSHLHLCNYPYFFLSYMVSVIVLFFIVFFSSHFVYILLFLLVSIDIFTLAFLRTYSSWSGKLERLVWFTFTMCHMLFQNCIITTK